MTGTSPGAGRSGAQRWAAYAAIAVLALVVAAAATRWIGLPAPPGLGTGSGQAEIGGPFTLIDHNGETVTDETFRGRILLVYFGYTYCPDICPTSLGAVADALDILGPAADAITPLFITVDPERDTPSRMKNYVTFFHPRLIGLTGTAPQTAAAISAYQVYAERVEESENETGFYLVDHSAFIYIMDRDGRFLGLFSHGTGPEAIAKRLRKIL